MARMNMAKKEEDIRNPDGTIKKGHSLNLKGRPRGTKNSASKAKLENLADKFGTLAFKEIYNMGKDAQEKGDLVTAFKCYSFVSGQFVTITLHNDRMQLQRSSKCPEELTEEESNDLQNGAIIQVNFKKADAV